MSIIIKGMDMPTNCGDCYFEQMGAEEDEYGDTCISYCLLTEWRISLSNRDDKILPSCPLVEIPTPHGRLIDGDALDGTIMKINSKEAYITRNDYKLIDNILFEMPTILEAEE